MLERTTLRERIVTTLRGNTAAGQNVFDSKMTAFSDKKLPAISVATLQQTGDQQSGSSIPFFDTSLTVTIEVASMASDNWAKQNDNICEQIENILFKQIRIHEEYSRIRTYQTASALLDGGEKPIVSTVITLVFEFQDKFPPVISDNLNKTDISVDMIAPAADPLPGPDGRIEAHFDIDHEQ